MSILWTSKRIFHEAKSVYFQSNEFTIGIENEYQNPQVNSSITRQLGWVVVASHPARTGVYWQKVPYDMIPHMRYIHWTVGGTNGFVEDDIVPSRIREVAGPERPTYQILQPLVDRVCALLASCHKINVLRVSIRSVDEKPGSIENLLKPLKELREIGKLKIVIWSMQKDLWVDFNLKASYALHLNKVLALPKGSPEPKWIDPRNPDESDPSIFDIIGAYWNRKSGFQLYSPLDDDVDNDVDEDDEDFEDEDEFEIDDLDLEYEEFIAEGMNDLGHHLDGDSDTDDAVSLD